MLWLFQFLLVVSCSVIGHHSEESVSTFLTSTPTRCLYTCIWCPWSVISPGWIMQSLQPPYIAHRLQYLHHLCALHWICSIMSKYCLHQESQDLTQHSLYDFSSTEERQRVTVSTSRRCDAAPDTVLVKLFALLGTRADCRPFELPAPSLWSCFPTSQHLCFFRLLLSLCMSAQACGSSAIPLSFVSSTNLLEVLPVVQVVREDNETYQP